jgi:polysaccharide biosynthesis transport protein
MDHPHDKLITTPAGVERQLGPLGGPGVPSPRISGPARQGGGSQTISAAFVLHALRQWWKVALPLGLLLAVVAAGIVHVLFRPMYAASAWLQIQDSTPFVAFEPQERENRSKRYVQTQVELIRSPMVLGPVVGRPEIARIPELKPGVDPVPWLAKRIKVTPIGDSEFNTVSFESTSPESASWLINAVVDQYFRLKDRDDAERTQRVIELLEQEKARRADEIGRLREDVRQLTKQATGKDPFAANPDGNYLRANPLAGLQDQLILAQVERQVLAAKVQALGEAAPPSAAEVPASLVAKEVEENAEVRRWKAELLARQSQMLEIESVVKSGRKDPNYAVFARAVARDEKILAQLRADVAKRLTAEMEGNERERHERELAEAKSQLANQTIREEALRKRHEAELKKLEVGSGETLQLQFKRSELAQAQQVLDRISARIAQLRTEQRAPARVTLWQRADTPSRPVDKSPYLKLLLAALAAFTAPFALAVGWERLVRRISDPEQFERESRLAVVGEIARIPRRVSLARRPALPNMAWDLHVFEESIDCLRTSLTLSEDLRDMRILAVTSAMKHEGKTSVATQLAASLARATEQPTLLIDGDMRAPDVHRLFNIPLGPGLADILGGDCALDDAIVTSWSRHLHLLPAGTLHTSPHKLLGHGVFDSLRGRLLDRYRYVVLDTPPLLAASEALVLARASDACLLCALRDVSRVGQVRRAYDRLVASGSRPAGIVLNGLPTRAYAHRYGSYAYTRDKS